MQQASGRFDVEMTPEPSADDPIGRFSVTKRFHGDLEGSGAGHMLAFRAATPGSAGYVLLEKVTGTLAGRPGSFVLQHSGIMDRQKPEQTIVVVPDSGTDALTGITGQMSIDAAAGHEYAFRYELPAPRDAS